MAKEIRVRLDGIDCPELRQAYGTKAKQYASARAHGKKVTVIAHGADDYGRTIGTVLIEDSRLNEELVALGLAWAYVYHSTEYASLEKMRAVVASGSGRMTIRCRHGSSEAVETPETHGKRRHSRRNPDRTAQSYM